MSGFRARRCAFCGQSARTETRSVIDRAIRPCCDVCRSLHVEPLDLVLAAHDDMRFEALPDHIRIRINVHVTDSDGDPAYWRATKWLDLKMTEALTARIDEEDDDDRLARQMAFKIAALEKKDRSSKMGIRQRITELVRKA